MSEGKWEEIEFAKLPSKAGLIYRNAFAHKDIIADKYAKFMESKETKVNATTLYPYDIVKGVTDTLNYWGCTELNETQRAALNKYWANQKDYLNGKPCKIMCVVDTSGSMNSHYNGGVKPIDVAISLGMYCGERIGEPFRNHFISFSSRPQLIEIEGVDFCDKVKRIYQQNLCENTDLKAVFDMLLDIYTRGGAKAEDMPEQLVVISDMEIDNGSYWRDSYRRTTEMEAIRNQWAAAGVKIPKLVYWNVAARHNNILDDSDNNDVTFISGCSPILFESLMRGMSGKDLMLEKLNSERYVKIR